MLQTRRSLLLAGAAAGTLVALPAVAAPPRGKPVPKAGQKTAPAATPAQTPVGPVDTLAKYAVVIDYNTGATLLEKNADTPNPPSSMTKLMTIYLTFKWLKEGKLKLGQGLLVSRRAWRKGGSKMFVPLGQTVSVRNLIRGVFVDSGNDAAIVLAEGIGGTEEAFAQMMNAEAKKLGMTHSHFMNATGWPAPGHEMSVRDIATLSAAIIRDFPEYYHYAGERTFTYDKIKQRNRNPLVMDGMADGLKTGHTDAGGYGEVGSTLRNGRRVILVLNGLPTWNSRISESKRLMDWAFNAFEDVTLFGPGVPVAQAKVWLGAAPDVALVGAAPIVVTLPRGWRATTKITTDYAAPVPAPIRKGQKLGRLAISGRGIPTDQASLRATLVAGADVPRLGLPGRAVAVLRHYITGA